MHTLTDTIHQQTNAITQRVNESSERLKQHMERATRRFILRMAIFILAADAVFFVAYTFA
jgi:hypothetical protein